MAHSPNVHDKGTRFTNYSSIHSADAWVGEYQVMFTPGSTSPQMNRQASNRKPSRFSRAVSASKQVNANQSFMLPANLPNTSQIMPDQGALPNIQVHYNIPADEKQIVSSLRTLQRDLADAMQTIQELRRERDEALHELRLLRATSRKPSSPVKRQSMAERVEEELFDISRSEDSIRRPARQSSNKKVAMDKQTALSDEARVLSNVPVNVVNSQRSHRQFSTKANVEKQQGRIQRKDADEIERSIAVEDPTAASNTSRRRRRPSLDDNMTSAYILPDITEQLPAQISREAQNVLHSLEPEHVAKCDVCRRLTADSRPAAAVKTQRQRNILSDQSSQPEAKQQQQHGAAKIDYTAQALGFGAKNIGFAVDESYLADPTLRPKISPAQALMRVRMLMNAQFVRAKERHNEAWEKYDSIDAPSSSRKHAQVGKEMRYWAEKMEECRVHLDYLRDVEEGMGEDEGIAT